MKSLFRCRTFEEGGGVGDVSKLLHALWEGLQLYIETEGLARPGPGRQRTTPRPPGGGGPPNQAYAEVSAEGRRGAYTEGLAATFSSSSFSFISLLFPDHSFLGPLRCCSCHSVTLQNGSNGRCSNLLQPFVQ